MPRVHRKGIDLLLGDDTAHRGFTGIHQGHFAGDGNRVRNVAQRQGQITIQMATHRQHEVGCGFGFETRGFGLQGVLPRLEGSEPVATIGITGCGARYAGILVGQSKFRGRHGRAAGVFYHSGHFRVADLGGSQSAGHRDRDKERENPSYGHWYPFCSASV